MRALTVFVAAALLVGIVPLPAAHAAGRRRSTAAATSAPEWPTYHQNPQSTGVAQGATDLNPLSSAWTSPMLDGQLYGEPLVDEGRIFDATESDTVYALAADNGQILWSHHLAAPARGTYAKCGGISPTVGITSTPVIDTARHEIFVVAEEQVGASGTSHHLVGLDIYTGKVELNEIVDPPGSHTASELQRAGLALADGRVIIGFGSDAGDCGKPYHGYVVAAPEGGGSPQAFEVDTGTGRRFGSVWQGGASPVVDPQGNIWVGTGNGGTTSSSQPFDRSDSVLELSPTLHLTQYFAPARWAADNAADADLGTTAPAFVDNFVFMEGKYRIAYLMDRSHLGGIGGDVASLPICGTGTGVDYSSSPYGGDTVDGSTVYVPCRDGVTAVAISGGPHPSMKILWTVPTGASGPAIVAGGLVWTMSQTQMLYGVNPATGATVVSEFIGGVSNHFPTPSVADGLLLVPSAVTVIAFKGPGGTPPPPPAPR